MSSNLILLIVAVVLSLPGGLFMAALMSEQRARFLALLGGIVGAVIVAAFVYYFIKAAHISIDALSYFLGAFFACSLGVFIGALLANFVVGLTARTPTSGATEF